MFHLILVTFEHLFANPSAIFVKSWIGKAKNSSFKKVVMDDGHKSLEDEEGDQWFAPYVNELVVPSGFQEGCVKWNAEAQVQNARNYRRSEPRKQDANQTGLKDVSAEEKKEHHEYGQHLQYVLNHVYQQFVLVSQSQHHHNSVDDQIAQNERITQHQNSSVTVYLHLHTKFYQK